MSGEELETLQQSPRGSNVCDRPLHHLAAAQPGPDALGLHALPACRSLGGPHVAGSVSEPRGARPDGLGGTDVAGTGNLPPPRHQVVRIPAFQFFAGTPRTAGARRAVPGGPSHPGPPVPGVARGARSRVGHGGPVGSGRASPRAIPVRVRMGAAPPSTACASRISGCSRALATRVPRCVCATTYRHFGAPPILSCPG